MVDYFVKMWKRMVKSSFAILDPHVKWLFIVMLCEAEQDGTLYATTEYLGTVARLSPELVEDALLKLMSPDPDSTSTEHEGRRVLATGQNEWRLVTYEKYRRMGQVEERRARDADRKRSSRGESADVRAGADECGQVRTGADTLGQTRTDTDASNSNSPSSSNSDCDEEECLPFADLWELVPTGRKQAKVKAQQLWEGNDKTCTGEKITAEEQRTIMDSYPFHVEMWKADAQPTDKIPHLRTWLCQRRWEDEVKGVMTKADLERHEREQERRTLVKHIIEYKGAVLETALELSREIQTLAKDHAANLNELVNGTEPKGIMNGMFYQMHDAFILAVTLALTDEQQSIIDDKAKGVGAGVIPEARERTMGTVKRKLVQELTGLPDPLTFEIAPEDIP